MYQVIIPKEVFKEIEVLQKNDQKLIIDKIKDLENGYFSNDKALQGKHKGKYRKRAGNYRIVYLRENNILLITLIRIAHRKEVY
jgi:mRNA interferase RelE/StbE